MKLERFVRRTSAKGAASVRSLGPTVWINDTYGLVRSFFPLLRALIILLVATVNPRSRHLRASRVDVVSQRGPPCSRSSLADLGCAAPPMLG
jgi:hypothetical protein